MTAPLRYPVYIPSKGRAHICMTADLFLREGVPFHLVVEPSQVEAYAEKYGRDRILVLPEDGRGLVYSRNWIKDYSREQGHARHWQFDDDIKYMSRLYKGYRLRCSSRAALAAAEEFVDRYENVALASFNSEFFIASAHGASWQEWPPFYLNSRCYTCFLVANWTQNRWRQRYNEDTDMTLQVLADGWCTILFNAFLISTPETMTHTGGQTDIYQHDGRLTMSRELERVWPGVVTTTKRFGRAQHKVKDHWRKFDTPLKRRADVDFASLPKVDERGLTLRAVSEVQSPSLRKLLGEGER